MGIFGWGCVNNYIDNSPRKCTHKEEYIQNKVDSEFDFRFILVKPLCQPKEYQVWLESIIKYTVI